MNFLSVADVRKDEGQVRVLKGISFTQPAHQKLAIAGESGSGKSNLLKIIAGYTQPDGGTVRFLGKRVPGPDEQLIKGHPGIAYLSQHFELRNNYWIEDVLSYSNRLSDQKAARIFEVCRITPFLRRKTDQVSGGEKQRIALARLLVGSPRLLLLDEPFSNLDLIHKGILKTVIREIGETLGLTCLLVSHDPLDTLPWAEKILVLRDGAIIQQGSPTEIYQHPVDEYTAALFGSYNLIDGRFIRPADIKIVYEGEGMAATVVRTFFLGDSYDIEVTTASGLLTLNTRTDTVKPGDQIHVSPQ
jgi:ABC-type sulfate/molybdate transport systems ATPase subunit